MTKEPEPQRTELPAVPQVAMQPPAAIDMERLTEMVYQLILTDLRLDRARQAPPRKERRDG